ncbi:MAG: hypothetical protein LBP73_08385, partial [Clostridiales Family XIII bacterium]|nr:hypothetical protein [Clostridiales Family XIII bacterium]
ISALCSFQGSLPTGLPSLSESRPPRDPPLFWAECFLLYAGTPFSVKFFFAPPYLFCPPPERFFAPAGTACSEYHSPSRPVKCFFSLFYNFFSPFFHDVYGVLFTFFLKNRIADDMIAIRTVRCGFVAAAFELKNNR